MRQVKGLLWPMLGVIELLSLASLWVLLDAHLILAKDKTKLCVPPITELRLLL